MITKRREICYEDSAGRLYGHIDITYRPAVNIARLRELKEENNPTCAIVREVDAFLVPIRTLSNAEFARLRDEFGHARIESGSPTRLRVNDLDTAMLIMMKWG